jgi:alpha-beta hydrolase superfamily lysophospholipase
MVIYVSRDGNAMKYKQKRDDRHQRFDEDEWLRVRTYTPLGEIKARAVIGHSWLTSIDGRIDRWSEYLAERGVACVTFDFPNHGLSSGDKGVINAQLQKEAFQEVVGCYAPQLGTSPLFYGGSSGGLTVAMLAYMDSVNSVSGIFGISPFVNLQGYLPFQQGSLQEIVGTFTPSGRSTRLSVLDGRQADVRINLAASSSSLQETNLMDFGDKIMAPAYVAYGLEDQILDPMKTRAFCELIPSDKIITHYPSGHGLEGYEDQILDEMHSFIERHA